jgi:hypothetical protein
MVASRWEPYRRGSVRAVPCQYASGTLFAGPPVCLGRRRNGLLPLQRPEWGDPRGRPSSGARRRDIRGHHDHRRAWVTVTKPCKTRDVLRAAFASLGLDLPDDPGDG